MKIEIYDTWLRIPRNLGIFSGLKIIGQSWNMALSDDNEVNHQCHGFQTRCLSANDLRQHLKRLHQSFPMCLTIDTHKLR